MGFICSSASCLSGHCHVSTEFRVAFNVISNIITFFVFNLNKVMKLLDHFKVILSRNKHHSIYTSYFTICFLYLNSRFAVTIKKCCHLVIEHVWGSIDVVIYTIFVQEFSRSTVNIRKIKGEQLFSVKLWIITALEWKLLVIRRYWTSEYWNVVKSFF